MSAMAEERKTRLNQYREHRIAAEQKLFNVMQMLSTRENITAEEARALAAVTEAMIRVQSLGC